MPLIRLARCLWLAAALSASTARAGVVAGPAPVYAPAAGAWAGPLSVAFAEPSLSMLLPPTLATLDLSNPTLMPREAAPLVQNLAHALQLTPKAFAKLDAPQKKIAIELAIEEVKDELRVKVYELADRARSLSVPGKNLSREERAELYGVVANLMEIREHYGGWIEDAAVEEAALEAYKISSAAAWLTRNALLEETGAALDEKKTSVISPARPDYALNPGASAKALREQMRATKSGWGQNDLHALYTGYGFELREGGKHRFYSHPAFPQLHESVSRQNDLPPGYSHSALKLIAELERLTAPAKAGVAAVAGPPITLTLADLSVLLSPPAPKIEEAEPMVEKTRRRERRATPLIPSAVAQKTNPDAPEPVLTLERPTVRFVERKADPPAAKLVPYPSGWKERAKALLDRLRGKRDPI